MKIKFKMVKGNLCKIKEFAINDKRASLSDFGSIEAGYMSYGEGCLGIKFKRKDICDIDLKYYGISKNEVETIFKILEKEIKTDQCNYCV